MKVILKEYVYLHGVAGDIVDVANGFARNFLIPQGKAVPATGEALEEHRQLMEQAAIRRAELNDQLVAIADRLNDLQLVFGRKAGRNGKLYGSVTTMDIADSILEKSGIDINRRRISERSLRELGEFNVPIRMSAELAPVVKVYIVLEEELEETLYRLEHGEELDLEDAEASAEDQEAVEEAVVEAVEDEVETEAADEVETAAE